MKYHIPAGTTIIRWPLDGTAFLPDKGHAVALKGGEFISTKDVVYDEEDRIGRPYLEWFLFRLPAGTPGYGRIAVRKEYVTTLLEKDEVQQSVTALTELAPDRFERRGRGGIKFG